MFPVPPPPGLDLLRTAATLWLPTTARLLNPCVLTAVVHTVLRAGEHVVHADQGEHGERSNQRASLDEDTAPQQGGVAGLVEQSSDHHLQVGEQPREHDPGQDLGTTDAHINTGAIHERLQNILIKRPPNL